MNQAAIISTAPPGADHQANTDRDKDIQIFFDNFPATLTTAAGQWRGATPEVRGHDA